jgi:hypothetical protein
MTEDDDDLVEILRRYPPEIRRAVIAKLEEMRCRLDADLGERTDEPEPWTCDECEQRIVGDDMQSPMHASFCSLHPSNDQTPTVGP